METPVSLLQYISTKGSDLQNDNKVEKHLSEQFQPKLNISLVWVV